MIINVSNNKQFFKIKNTKCIAFARQPISLVLKATDLPYSCIIYEKNFWLYFSKIGHLKNVHNSKS